MFLLRQIQPKNTELNVGDELLRYGEHFDQLASSLRKELIHDKPARTTIKSMQQ